MTTLNEKFAKAMINDAIADLDISKNLKAMASSNPQNSYFINRRRLFFLEQAEEKSVKSVIIIYALFTTFMPLFSIMLRDLDSSQSSIDANSIEILTNRSLRRLKTFVKMSYKDFTHNPLNKMDIINILEDEYIILSNMGIEREHTQVILDDCAILKRENSLEQLLTEIENRKARDLDYRKRWVMSLEELSKNVKYGDDGKPKMDASIANKLFKAFIIPLGIYPISFMSLHLSMLKYLSTYVSASRYPPLNGEDLTEPLSKLDQIQEVVEESINSFSGIDFGMLEKADLRQLEQLDI